MQNFNRNLNIMFFEIDLTLFEHDLSDFKIIQKFKFHPINSFKMSSDAELQAKLKYHVLKSV